MSKGVLSRFGTLLFVGTFVVLGSSLAQASDVTWGGSYRVEANKIFNPDMSTPTSDKSYLLHHMVLTPKIVAADGFVIYGRMDILNDPNFGIDNTGRVYSVAGDLIGNNPNPYGLSQQPPNGSVTNSYGKTQRANPVQITSLYGTWNHEFGQLVVGRVPLQFGLGTAFSAGNGAFDHYISTKDLIGYKVVLGNLFVLPMLAKTSEGALGQEDDVDDYMIHVQYDNPETELSLGFLYQLHVALGNDAPLSSTAGGTDTPMGGPGATRTGSFKNTLMGIYASEKIFTNWRLSVEADMASGDTGIQTATNAGVSLNSFGVAAELAYQPNDSKWNGVLKMGLATGDDPGTNDVYEGYQFNRNYDVAMLLFNHPLGKRDFLRTGLVRDVSSPASSEIDTEAISNALYVAPSVTFRSRDNLSYGGSLIYGMLNKDPIGPGAGTSLNLGTELDLNVTYKPFERMTWTTEAGVLLPGDAWRGGNLQLENKMPYGISTKAAINF